MSATFEADTALERVGDLRWRGAIAPHWFIFDSAFGGYVTALLTRALIAANDDPARLPRSLTVHFLAPPREGEVEVAARVERSGGSATTFSLALEQRGQTLALALASVAKWRDGAPEWHDSAPPPAPPPQDCPRLEASDRLPRFFANFELRWVEGGAPGRASERARNVAWVRTDPPRALDHVLLGMLGDCILPPALSRLGRFVVVPTADLTVHFRSPVPQDGGDWVLAVHHSQLAAGGVWESDAEIWSPSGELLVQGRQLALVR